ncbi:MAG: 30S ribosomal protein S20 [Synergistaceae bacterium]|nr:30S ribosomal protein S20 [Synergistaceae bacterium]MBQ6737968.1 30S ribosomal protein S20 [Synergistaceae bacterium]MBQ7067557.1 30S ribosomal protein S20 [Synergistaceae bacterium]MBR0076337.1 30S ribosomal protein S20 [Synergistaceae bacterium]MBR0080040.1 30S ribosomal protein S20 [Synergistaceae bacterium]
MPNKKSAEKRVLIAERNRLYNKVWTSKCKTAVKNVLEAVASGNKDEAFTKFNAAQSVIDKAVVKGVMHKNTASRRKELMSRRLKALSV